MRLKVYEIRLYRDSAYVVTLVRFRHFDQLSRDTMALRVNGLRLWMWLLIETIEIFSNIGDSILYNIVGRRFESISPDY